jgi:ABC-2 type transport system ATP-binding protein
MEEGEIFGFIGPNGAGKSTTIRTFLNLLFPTSGKAEILGYDVVKESKDLKKYIGYVPADVSYYSNMTASTLLQYSAKFYGLKADSIIGNYAERFQLNLHRKFSDLSTGNRKKVAIIQSLIHQPRLLILDEPTNGLDPLMQNTFFDALHEVNRNGTGIFFSSHNLNEVRQFCQRVAIVRNGTVVAVESVDELLKKQAKNCRIVLGKGSEISGAFPPGVSGLQQEGNVCRFLYNGEITNLLQWLNSLKLVDAVVEEPALEDIFMHYYDTKKGG